MIGQQMNGFMRASENGLSRGRLLTKRPDYTFTYSNGMSLCCIAAEYGMLHGFNSNMPRKCPKHDVAFIDNEYSKPYNHAKHLACVAEFKPKYATVRDIMPPEMCKGMGVQYYEPQQILDWAEELSEHAENVIIIPKHDDYFELIPSQYIVGFPTPSDYGGANEADAACSIESYLACERLHILGGSWAKQLSYLYHFGNAVVSIDGNSIARSAQIRQYTDPAGQMHSLNEAIHYELDNALHVCFTLSCSAIQTSFNKLILGG